jgi:Protein of unknown function (DUF1153)
MPLIHKRRLHFVLSQLGQIAQASKPEDRMYLRKVQGPRAVTLPDGSVMTRADLPPDDTKRWVASRKAAVVRALTSGLITREEAIERYSLSEEEIDSWVAAVARHGERALRTTRLQAYRQL